MRFVERKTMKELTKNIILAVYLNDRDDSIAFKVTDGADTAYLSYDAEGDCCSHSWFNEINGFDALKNGLVREVEMIDMPEGLSDKETLKRRLLGEELPDENDRLQNYGIKITTDKGYASIVFRNESNGYYGGYLRDVEFLDKLAPNFREITDDWSA